MNEYQTMHGNPQKINEQIHPARLYIGNKAHITKSFTKINYFLKIKKRNRWKNMSCWQQ
jgi:hypothetical protein